MLAGLVVLSAVEGGSQIRNPVLARVFSELGLIEQWGTGLPKAMDALVAAGLPPMDIEEGQERLRVTIHIENHDSAKHQEHQDEHQDRDREHQDQDVEHQDGHQDRDREHQDQDVEHQDGHQDRDQEHQDGHQDRDREHQDEAAALERHGRARLAAATEDALGRAKILALIELRQDDLAQAPPTSRRQHN